VATMMHRKIPINSKNGVLGYALVDANDFETVAKHKWRLRNGYAVAWITIDAETKSFYMHRFLMGLVHGDKRQVDHKNLNRLDNRRKNMRIVSGSLEQTQNQGSRPGSSSKYRGVSWDKQHRKWEGSVTINYKKFNLGLFENEEDAANAAYLFRQEHMPYTLS
jgi:hypothetical protein